MGRLRWFLVGSVVLTACGNSADADPARAFSATPPLVRDVETPNLRVRLRVSPVANLVAALAMQATKDSFYGGDDDGGLRVTWDDDLIERWVEATRSPDSRFGKQSSPHAIDALLAHGSALADRAALTRAFAEPTGTTTVNGVKKEFKPTAKQLENAKERVDDALEILTEASANPRLKQTWQQCEPKLRASAQAYEKLFTAKPLDQVLAAIRVRLGIKERYTQTFEVLCKWRGSFAPLNTNIETLIGEGAPQDARSFLYALQSAFSDWFDSSPALSGAWAELEGSKDEAATVVVGTFQGYMDSVLVLGWVGEGIDPETTKAMLEEYEQSSPTRVPSRMAVALHRALHGAGVDLTAAIQSKEIVSALLAAAPDPSTGKIPPRYLTGSIQVVADASWESHQMDLQWSPSSAIVEVGGGGRSIQLVGPPAKKDGSLGGQLRGAFDFGFGSHADNGRTTFFFLRPQSLPWIATRTDRLTRSDVAAIQALAGSGPLLFGVKSDKGATFVFVAQTPGKVRTLLEDFYAADSMFVGRYQRPKPAPTSPPDPAAP